jgi:spore germination protein KC
VEELAIVMGCAIDRGKNGQRYQVTVEMADLSSGASEGEIKSAILELQGNTIFEAMRNAREMISQKLYFSNCYLIIISDELAREGIMPLIDFFNRDHEGRSTLQISISQEKTAREILMCQPLIHPLASYELAQSIKSNNLSASTTNFVQLYQVVNILADRGKSLALSALDTVENNEELRPHTNGVAILDGDRLKGYLGPDETRYFLMATGQMKSGILAVNATAMEHNNVSLEVLGTSSEIRPVLENGNLSFTLDVNVKANIGDTGSQHNIIGVEGREAFIKNAEIMLNEHVDALIEKMQRSYGTDIFGFGKILSQQEPELWEKLKGHWGSVFQTLEVKVQCKLWLRRSGFTIAPIELEG